jgi:hypothetical protein
MIKIHYPVGKLSELSVAVSLRAVLLQPSHKVRHRPHPPLQLHLLQIQRRNTRALLTKNNLSLGQASQKIWTPGLTTVKQAIADPAVSLDAKR